MRKFVRTYSPFLVYFVCVALEGVNFSVSMEAIKPL